MDDQFLDEVLRKVQDPQLHYYESLEATYDREEVIFKLKPAIDFLLENGYITSRDVGSQKYLDISPKGMRHVQAGGFVQVGREQKELLRYAKGSHDYARKAFIVGLLALIVAILSVLVAIKW